MEEDGLSASAASTRQKSCNACVQAKRGCDRQYPVCSRCAEKAIDCVYAKKRLCSEAFQTEFEFGSIHMEPAWADPGDPSPANFFSLPTPGPADPPTMLNISGELAPNGEFDFMQFFGDTRGSSSKDMEMVPATNGRQLERLDEEELIQNDFDYGQMADLCDQFQLWHVYDPTQKVHFLVNTLKSYPAIFAKQSHTPWMHQNLYKDHMEPSIKLCFTICALYTNMTESSKPSVLRVICESGIELKELHTPGVPREKLARAQALLLLQIIRLFDGDITLRSLAEDDMALLEAWLGELCRIRDNLKTPKSTEQAGARMKEPPGSWEWWRFAESVRRTILLGYCFIGLWQMTRRPSEAKRLLEAGPWRFVHHWTMSRHLWEAASSFDFSRAWAEKPHYIIGNMEFQDFLKTGKGDNVDDFGRLFMVAYMGLDETKEWFMNTGSKF